MKKEQIIKLSIGAAISIVVIVLVLLLTKHTHSFGEWEKYRDPSCSEFGIDRRFCSCGKIQEKKIDKLPHTESNWIVDDEVNLRKIVCTVCNRLIKSESLKDHIHVWSEWTEDTAPTCTDKGSMSRTCECGGKESITLASLGHSFSDWTIITDAQCEIDGSMERYCTVCSFAEKRDIDALTHTEGNWIVIENEKIYPCIYCGITIKSEQIYISEGLNISNGMLIGIGSCTDTDIVIPSSCNNSPTYFISEQAFEYSKISSIIMPDTITVIGENAFYQCSDLKLVSMSKNISQIDKKAFFKCSSLKSISLPDSLINIGEFAFAYCSELETVYIGNSISKLDIGVFQDCKSLHTIYFNGTAEEWKSIEKDKDWDRGTQNYIIHCTNGTIEK